MNKFLLSFMPVIVSAFLLSACKNSGSTEGVKKSTTDLDGHSCAFGPSEGNEAKYAALGDFRVKKTYFEKEYYEAYVDAVATANVNSTIDFINLSGATVYKAPSFISDACSRELMTRASFMPSDIAKLWNPSGKADSKLSESDSVVLGVYFSKDRVVTASLMNSAAIIVRENADRRTLLHEFMHHLFHSRAVAKGYNHAAAAKRYYDAQAQMEIIIKKKLPAKETAQLLAAPFLIYADTGDSFLVHSTLEEMTVDAELNEMQRAGKLQFAVADESAYIHQSAHTLYEDYRKLNEQLIQIKDSPGFATDPENKQSFDELVNFQRRIQSRWTEVHLIINANPYVAPLTSPGVSGVRSGLHKHRQHEHSNLFPVSEGIQSIQELFRQL